ncbi:hypothetical protein [Geotalea sp. SG265]|nr:hypothetical protein [Geotalea sp. SG265]
MGLFRYLGLAIGDLCGLCLALAPFPLWRLEETVHKDLDYFEDFL